MPIGNIQQSDNLNTLSTVLTTSSAMVASVVYGDGIEDDNPIKTCWIQLLSPLCLLMSLNAEVLVVVVVVGCVQGS